MPTNNSNRVMLKPIQGTVAHEGKKVFSSSQLELWDGRLVREVFKDKQPLELSPDKNH